MRYPIAASFLVVSVLADAQSIEPGRWDVTSTVTDLAAPGVPAFLQRMARGRSSTEHKLVAAGQGIKSLLVPDPKARCTVDSEEIADGRYAQTITCAQKRGGPLKITRNGTYDASGFVGQAIVAGTTGKGSLRIVLNQRAARSTGK